MIICKSPKTYFGFIPVNPDEFWVLLTENLPRDDIHECLSALICTQICSQVGCESLQSIEKYNGSTSKNSEKYIKSEEHEKLSFLSFKAFAIMRLAGMKMDLKETFAESVGKERFSAVNTDIHTDSNMKILGIYENGMVRFSAKHLIGCPHILSWKGTIRYHRLLGRKTWAEFHCNAWAFHCRVVAGGEHTCGKSVIEVPSEFWKLLPKELFILSIKLPQTSIAVDDSMPIVVMELGTAPKTLVDDMVTSKKIRVAFVSEISK